MSDKLLMENYLLILKSTMEVYVHGTLESSNDSIRKCLKMCLDDTVESQSNTYKKMVDNNWYQVTNIKDSEIKKVYDKLINN